MKDVLFIKGTRTGYGVDQCPETVTVKQLIEILRDYDEDTPIYLNNDNGYTYGHIDEGTISLRGAAED